MYVQNQQPSVQPIITKVPIVSINTNQSTLNDSRQREIFEREKQDINNKFQSEINQLKYLN